MERNENGMPSGEASRSRGLGALDGFFNGAVRNDATENGTVGNGMRNRCRNMPARGNATDLESLPLAYAYVPWQKWQILYSPAEALENGTLFEELNKPLGVYGNE